MWATFVGNSGGNAWSNPSAWAGGTVPNSGKHLNIRLDAPSTGNLGTVESPFVADDVIGATTGATYPGFFLTGFLHADDVANISYLQVASSGGLTVRHNLANVENLVADDGGTIAVGHDLRNVKAVDISFGSSIEVGHKVGNASFVFGIGGGTLILDDPDHHALGNALTLGAPTVNIELGHVRFDQADFIPDTPNGLTGQIDLLEHGRLAYALTNVRELAPAGVLSAGVDKTTGYDFVSYHA